VPQRGGNDVAADEARLAFAFFGAGTSSTSRNTAPGGGPSGPPLPCLARAAGAAFDDAAFDDAAFDDAAFEEAAFDDAAFDDAAFDDAAFDDAAFDDAAVDDAAFDDAAFDGAAFDGAAFDDVVSLCFAVCSLARGARRASALVGVGWRFFCLCAGRGSSVFFAMEPFKDARCADERCECAQCPVQTDEDDSSWAGVRPRCSRGGL
jgi:hypothetical protein